jgi:hypothetical protein
MIDGRTKKPRPATTRMIAAAIAGDFSLFCMTSLLLSAAA